MGVAKASLIVVGTAVGLGGVLAYQPPHHTLGLGGGLGGGLKGLGGGTATPTPTPAPTETTPAPVDTPTPTPTPKPKKTKTPTGTATTPAAPKPTASKKPVKKGPVNGTFTGAVGRAIYNGTDYGPVQIQIQVVNSKIVAVAALQLPSATPMDQTLNQAAVPILTNETIAASSSEIQGVSGASATSQGWYDSLVSALAKAKI